MRSNNFSADVYGFVENIVFVAITALITTSTPPLAASSEEKGCKNAQGYKVRSAQVSEYVDK